MSLPKGLNSAQDRQYDTQIAHMCRAVKRTRANHALQCKPFDAPDEKDRTLLMRVVTTDKIPRGSGGVFAKDDGWEVHVLAQWIDAVTIQLRYHNGYEERVHG
jgi:hypothetical protein